MTSQEIFDLAIKMGIKADLRGERAVQKYLARTKKKYDKLDNKAKKFFDKDSLDNPYADTRFLFNTGKKKDIKKVMVGIDLKAEMILGREMGADLFINHHPLGKALAGLDGVMDTQVEVLSDYGVPINIAEQVIKPRISEVGRSVTSGNYNKEVDMARLIDIDLMCLHSVCDNMGANHIKELVEKKKPEYVEDLMELLMEIPEYKEATMDKAGPKIFVGSAENRCGKIAVTEFTGGTSGSKDIYAKLANAGIGTVIGMHISEEHRKEAEANHVNVVIAGHMSSDSIGLNFFCDELEKKGLEIIPCSGFIRVSRNKKK